MVKVTVKKRNVIKNKPDLTIKKVPTKLVKKNKDVEEILVENFVSLQKVMTNLAVKFDNLSTQISKLLELFEISAKTIAEKNPELVRGEKNNEMVEKLDNLIEQNKVIARGLTLLHETNSPQQPIQPPIPPQQLQPPRNPINPKIRGKRPVGRIDEYQKSISPRPKDEPKI